MGFVKAVFKRVLIAAVAGALVLGFVYYKDNYLEQDSSDMEILHSVSLEKEESKEIPKDQAKLEPLIDEEEPLSIEVHTPQQDKDLALPKLKSEPKEEKIEIANVIEEEKPIAEQSFEEFKQSLEFRGKQSAFDELDSISK